MDQLHDLPVALIQRAGAVCHINDQIRSFCCLHGTVYADLFHYIFRVPDSRRIHYMQADPLKVNMLL